MLELRNQLENRMDRNQQAVESRMDQNQQVVESRLAQSQQVAEQSQQMMAQMMNLLTQQQQGVAPLAQQPIAAIAAPVRNPSPPRPSILSPPILSSVSDYQQLRRRTPVDNTIFNDQFSRRAAEQTQELAHEPTQPPFVDVPDRTNRAVPQRMPEMGPAFVPIPGSSSDFSDVESDSVTHR